MFAADLRDELRERDLPVSGNKYALIARLQADDEEVEEEPDPEDEPEEPEEEPEDDGEDGIEDDGEEE